MPRLDIQHITVKFGGLTALSDLSFVVNAGEIVGLIGPNGAGKTTIFNVLTGVYHASEGDVTFEDKSLLGKRPYQIFSRGIARTFQNIRLFSNMTAIENAMVARHCQIETGGRGRHRQKPVSKKEEAEIRKSAQ